MRLKLFLFWFFTPRKTGIVNIEFSWYCHTLPFAYTRVGNVCRYTKPHTTCNHRVLVSQRPNEYLSIKTCIPDLPHVYELGTGVVPFNAGVLNTVFRLCAKVTINKVTCVNQHSSSTYTAIVLFPFPKHCLQFIFVSLRHSTISCRLRGSGGWGQGTWCETPDGLRSVYTNIIPLSVAKNMEQRLLQHLLLTRV